MTERAKSERLDEAVEQLMTNRTPSASLSPELTALLQIAADLRDLPSADFKTRLRAELQAAAAPSYRASLRDDGPPLRDDGLPLRDDGPPVRTADEIAARLAVLATPRLVAHDVAAALDDLPELTMRFLAQCAAATVTVSRYATQEPVWERHPAGDELLYVVAGGLDVTTIGAEGPVETRVDAGSLFVCRRGLWHWPRPRGEVSLLSLTPGEGSEHGSTPGAAVDAEPPSRSHLTGDLPSALRDLPTVTITRDTTEAEANAAVRELGRLEDRLLGVMRFAGETPWERHPDGDELLYVLDGEVEVTVLAADGPTPVLMPAGSIFVCPQGLWHRQKPTTSATILFATPTATREASWADDPRAEGGQ